MSNCNCDYGYGSNCDCNCIPAIRFKTLYPDYETFIKETNLTQIPPEMFNQMLLVYGCKGFKWDTGYECNSFTTYWVGIYYQNYLKYKDLMDIDLKDLGSRAINNKSASFNPQNINLESFSETDNSYLNQFIKSIGTDSKLSGELDNIKKGWFNINEKFINELGNSILLPFTNNICGEC